MYAEIYALGEVGVIILFGVVTAACLVAAPYVGRKLGLTVPNKDRADYIIRAQSTLITVTALLLAFSLVQAQGNLRKTEELVANEASTFNTLDACFRATVCETAPRRDTPANPVKPLGRLTHAGSRRGPDRRRSGPHRAGNF